MKKVKDLIVSAFAIVGFISIISGFTNFVENEQKLYVEIEKQQFNELKSILEQGFFNIENKFNSLDVNVAAVGNRDAIYLITEGDGKFLLNVKNN